MDDVIKFPGTIDRGSMGEVAAMQQAHPHDGVTGVNQRLIYRVVGWRSRKRLHIYIQVVCRQTIGGKSFGAAPAC